MTDREQDEGEVVFEAPVPAGRKLLTIADQAERNRGIVNARNRSTAWPTIAKKYGLSVRRCEMIYLEWRSTNPTLRESDPVEIVDDMVLGYQALLEDLQATAQSTRGTAKVGALNAKARVYRELAELLQQVGVLPKDLGTMHLHIDGRITAERIVTVMERYDLPEEVFDAVLDALGGTPDALPATDTTAEEL